MKLEIAKIVVIVITAIGLLFVAAQAVFLMVPTYREIKELAGKIVEAETEVQAQYDNRRNLLETTVKIHEARKTMEELGIQFIPAGGELAFITALEEVAERNGVDLQKQLTARTGELPEFNHGVDVTVNGPYRNVMRTLVDIERMATLIEINDISLQGGGGADPETAALAVTFHGIAASPPKGL